MVKSDLVKLPRHRLALTVVGREFGVGFHASDSRQRQLPLSVGQGQGQDGSLVTTNCEVLLQRERRMVSR